LIEDLIIGLLQLQVKEHSPIFKYMYKELICAVTSLKKVILIR